MVRAARITLTALIAVSALQACTSVEPQTSLPVSEIGKVYDEVLENKAYASSPPQAVNQALLPNLDLSLPSAEQDDVFDVVVDNVPAKEFFLSLVEDTPYNVIVHPSVTGSISLQLKSVTVPQVMEAVKGLYGYDYESTQFGFKVLPFGITSRIYHIDYLNFRRQGRSETRVRAGQVTDAGTASTDGDTTTTSTASGTSTATGGSGAGTQISTTTDANFWSDLAEILQFIVGEQEGRVVVANPHSGVVLVKATPEEHRAVKNYLDKTQLSIQRQVILEAKILEVELKDSFHSGIDWTQITEPKDGRPITYRQGIKGELAPNQLLVNDIGQNLGGIFSASFNLSSFKALIELLETQGNVQVLSSPQVATVNNQKAVIRVGTDEFFVTDISFENNEDADGDDNRSTDIELTPFFSGIALDVLPQISEEGFVTLHIHPSISEVQDQEKIVTIGDREVVLPLANSTIRESDSVVRAKSGQVVVIGGLIQNITREQVAAVPVLGSIPYLGTLFRQTQQNSTKSELVILLRPVLVDDQSRVRSLAESKRRFDEIQRGYHLSSKSGIFGNQAELEPY